MKPTKDSDTASRRWIDAAANELARALDQIHLRCGHASFSRIESEYRSLEADFSAARRELARIVRRATAERLLDAAMDRKLQASVCKTYYNVLRRCGFADELHQAEVQIKFSRYLIAVGHKRAAARLLSDALVVARKQLSRSSKSVRGGRTSLATWKSIARAIEDKQRAMSPPE